jgi:hypothetical protein
MALSDSVLSAALKKIFDQMTTEKSNEWYADQLAAAIDAQIKTAVVTGSVTSGEGSGGSVVGGLS